MLSEVKQKYDFATKSSSKLSVISCLLEMIVLPLHVGVGTSEWVLEGHQLKASLVQLQRQANKCKGTTRKLALRYTIQHYNT